MSEYFGKQGAIFGGAMGVSGVMTMAGGSVGPIGGYTQPVYTVSLCDDDADWTESLSGSFDKSDLAEGPLQNDGAMLMTQTNADGLAQIYIDYSTPVDWSMYTKIGYWYNGSVNDVFTANDIKLLIFQDGITAYANAEESLDACGTFTEAAAAEWKYIELTFADTDGSNRKAVTRVAFYSLAGTDGNALAVANVELFQWSTGSGPAYGTIRSAPVESAVIATQGVQLEFRGNGRVTNATGSSRHFAGVAIETVTGNAAGSTFVRYVEDKVVNLKALEILTAGDGVVVSTAATNEVWDGGASTEDLQFGVAMVTCVANDLCPVLIGSRGFVGTVGA